MTSTHQPHPTTGVGRAIRGEFPIFETTTYLNSCSQGALSRRVHDAVGRWLTGWDENGAEWGFWVEQNEAFRAAMARLLDAASDDLAVTTSVSQGASALMSALPLGKRNRIVISEYEFPTIGQIAHAQELRGAEVVHVRPDANETITAEHFADAIDERTALVCCTTISYRSGHRHDIASIAEAAHAVGALVLADSYQACGAVDIDVRSFGADAITGGTVKYLLGTAGLGFMWVRPEVRERLVPTQTGWFADEDIFAMSIADYSPHPSARRFDSGTPPVPALYAGGAGVALVETAGVPAIEAHIEGLVDRLLDGLDGLDADIVTPREPSRRGPLVCVRSTDVETLVRELATARIIASSRQDCLRVALHLYNVEDDVDILLDALGSHPSLLSRRTE
jgi:selenocysteine lyase/cysteine desulfurase